MIPSIDYPRLDAQLQAINAINRQDDGSCCRIAQTPADTAGRDLVVGWMKEAGLSVHIDRIGNIFGVQTGEGAPVMTGSHIDTVATGGRFDGTYGVLSGLEVIRTLHDAGVTTRRPLAVAVFTNEEGVRFQPDMMGSLVHAGGLSVEDALAATDPDGVTLDAALTASGYAGTMACGTITPHAFVELHIEQGPILDAQGRTLSAVENLQGISWREVVVRGSANHAGTTPMPLRRDAAYVAAQVVVFVRGLATRMGGAQVSTVGSMQLSPNLVNVIAREARFTVDLRNTDDDLLRAAEAELEAYLVELAQAEGVTIETRDLARTPPVVFSPTVVAAIEQVCADLQQPVLRMTSGAGHDAQMMARICPAAMIFVPSIKGVSHNPREDTRAADLELGANVLLRTMLALAQEP
jgi:N-carbamoyl-L-amino-acid hydrolase